MVFLPEPDVYLTTYWRNDTRQWVLSYNEDNKLNYRQKANFNAAPTCSSIPTPADDPSCASA
jgi:hypothetical protein